MSDCQTIPLHDSQLAFFGEVTAGISHELNNVMAIINEYSGLLDDLGRMGEPDELEDVPIEKIRRPAAAIQAQIDRGKRIVRRLNRFAHCIDQPSQSVDAREIVEDALEFARRHSARAGVSLERGLPDQPVPLATHPFVLLHAVYDCIRAALDVSRSGETVQVDLWKTAHGVRIGVGSAGGVDPERVTAPASTPARLAAELAGRIELATETNRHAIYLIVEGKA